MRAAVVLVGVVVAGCSFRSGQAPPDAGEWIDAAGMPTDAREVPVDAMPDAPLDAPPDAPLDAPPDAPPEPPALVSITPALGSVAGGTMVLLERADFASGATVAIGGIGCTPVIVMSPALLLCTTGDSHFVEGAKDVIVANPDGQSATLAARSRTSARG